MTKLVELIRIDIELDGKCSTMGRSPREQLRVLWQSIGHILDAQGKWHVSGPGLSCWVTNLGLEEVPEEDGGDN